MPIDRERLKKAVDVLWARARDQGGPISPLSDVAMTGEALLKKGDPWPWDTPEEAEAEVLSHVESDR